MEATTTKNRLAGWRITDHVQQQMAERAIPASDVISAILDPAEVEDKGASGVHWGEDIGVAWKKATDPITNRVVRYITTVLMSGSSRGEWKLDAAEMAVDRFTSHTVEELLEMLVVPEKKPTRRTPARRATRKPAPVEVRNMYDRFSDGMMRTIRGQLEAMGLDPEDLSPVRIIGRGRIEIIPPEASKD